MTKEYEVVIGLEVHAELSTDTKIFCACKNEFGDEPNTNVCPICLAMPGTMPALNKKVVDYAVKMAHATHSKLNLVSKFDRKHYFYPDLTKAYQISQFDETICSGGYVDVHLDGGKRTKRIRLHHIHIEEDAGKLLHEDGFPGSLCDFNRCGVPLLEIVSEPDMRSAEEAKAYLEGLRGMLSYLDISDCNMHEGSIRCDVNVSVMPKGSEVLGTRVEIKNVNSFSAAGRAIEYESARQIDMVENGISFEQETRKWDDAKGVTIGMRSKGNAADYRYFPDPNLITLVVDAAHAEALAAEEPEFSFEKISRYMAEDGLPYADAVLIADIKDRADFYDATASLGLCSKKSISNWLLGDIAGYLNEKNLEISDISMSPKQLAEMISAQEKNEISSAAAKTVLAEILFTGKDPAEVIKEKGLAQISDTGFLEEIVRDVLAANPKAVEDYKKGKTNVTGFLVGQCMKNSKGRGNPAILGEIILKQLAE